METLIAQLRSGAARGYQRSRDLLMRMPVKARWVLGIFLAAALILALHTALSVKDSTLHLHVQHDFRSADLSVWVDGDLVYSGQLRGATKKKFGLIPESVQGSFSQAVAVPSGTREVRVRVVSDDGSSQEDSISGDFVKNASRDLSVSAHHRGVSLNWLNSGADTMPASTGWFGRYASSFLLTVAGSLISALTGFVLKELPGRLKSPAPDSKAQSSAAGQ